MDTNEINRTIAEKMGLCWHEWTKGPRILSGYGPTIKCTKCGITPYKVFAEGHPDFTTPEGFFRAWNWAKGKEWWSKFLYAYGAHEDYGSPIANFEGLINPPVFAAAIAKFIKEEQLPPVGPRRIATGGPREDGGMLS